ncbi:hypothetical protein AND_008641 [Anopheles darlingi]|uniref:Phorbol-ester/DAG-type domain-containing protein n=1 Tax=Anopheles darlingi TaxID=43151 RepID=W5J6Z8_ANODA|nr:hypothetical protein AND_008641 [Anopheles darlingi]
MRQRFSASVRPPAESSKSHRHNIFSKRGTTPSGGPAFLGGSMSSSSGGGVLKDLGHPGLNEALKSHNGVTFKLVKTVSDFSETLAQLYEQHAEALQVLVSSYRKRNSELRKERPACQSNLFSAWETLLQEIEADSQATIDVASTLSRQVARPLLERSFYRKVQSRKVFTHRESFDTIISKTEEKLSKCRIEYKQCYIAHRQTPTQHTLTQYIDSHNAYVQQLHATNAMLEAYHCDTLPQLMQELEEIYSDLCNIVSEAVMQGAEAIAAKEITFKHHYRATGAGTFRSNPEASDKLPLPAGVLLVAYDAHSAPYRTSVQTMAADDTSLASRYHVKGECLALPVSGFAAMEQAKRYDGLAAQCKNVSPALDLGYFVRTLPLPPNVQRIPRKAFAPPQPTNSSAIAQAQDHQAASADELQDSYGMDPMGPVFKDELVVDKGASIQVRPSVEALRRESQELEIQIKQLQDSVDALVRTQMRGIEGQLYNKANEIQEDISMKKFDIRAKQIHLAAVRAQKELFLGRIDPGSPRGERKMSSSSSSSMKTKWLKAFRSLKPAGSANDRKSGNGAQIRFDGTDNHNLQEYTYKKITPCDVCSQVLRGHTRQGLRCRICKVNVHADCASQLPKCQVKQKLLRRQKSTSEIENRAVEVEDEKPPELDQIYQVLKQAGEISSGKVSQLADSSLSSKGGAAAAAAAAAAASGGGGAGSASSTTGAAVTVPLLDIPVVKVPEYPDRAPWRGGGPVKSQGPNYPHQKQGLSAPVVTDMSSSAIRVPVNLHTHQPTAAATTLSTATMATVTGAPPTAIDSGARRRLFAGFRPMSGFGLLRLRSAQHRSISLPETEEDDIMLSTRPFGQPLCFVVEEPPPDELQSGKKDGKRKK